MPFVGSDILARVMELGDVSKSDVVRGCDYVIAKDDGTERLNFDAFYKVFLEAKGFNDGKGVRKLTYVDTVQANGNLLIGKSYMDQLGLEPGDQFEIKLDRKQIKLKSHIMLTGADLLAKVEELGDVSKSDLARSCGYVSTNKGGSERLNLIGFYEAVMEAQNKLEALGIRGVGGRIAKGDRGRKRSHVATVEGNGNLLIGKG